METEPAVVRKLREFLCQGFNKYTVLRARSTWQLLAIVCALLPRLQLSLADAIFHYRPEI